MNKKLSLALFSLLLLTACGSTGSKAENAGKAMAETACLLFNEDVNMEEIAAQTDEIMKKYGFEKAQDIDDYIATIQGTDELNTVSTNTENELKAKCGEALTAKGVEAADLAKAMVSQ